MSYVHLGHLTRYDTPWPWMHDMQPCVSLKWKMLHKAARHAYKVGGVKRSWLFVGLARTIKVIIHCIHTYCIVWMYICFSPHPYSSDCMWILAGVYIRRIILKCTVWMRGQKRPSIGLQDHKNPKPLYRQYRTVLISPCSANIFTPSRCVGSN